MKIVRLKESFFWSNTAKRISPFDQEISQETKRISFLISASVTHFTLASMGEVGSEWMLLLVLLEM